MPDLEKAIKGLELCLVSIDSEGCTKECPYYEACQKSEFYDVFQPVMKDALELLKAQEQDSKKIIAKGNVYECPWCGEEVFIDTNPNYCGYCGKAVKWDA